MDWDIIHCWGMELYVDGEKVGRIGRCWGDKKKVYHLNDVDGNTLFTRSNPVELENLFLRMA